MCGGAARVIVDPDGNVTLELQAPFAYLSNAVRTSTRETEANKKDAYVGVLPGPIGSTPILSCVPGEIRTPDFLFRRQALYPLSYRHVYVVKTR